MNIVLTVIAVLVAAITGIPACRILMSSSGASILPPVMCIAGAAVLVAGAVMSHRKMKNAVIVLWVSVALYVIALATDASGTSVEFLDEVSKSDEIYGGGAVWAAISAGCDIYARKKAAKAKED